MFNKLENQPIWYTIWMVSITIGSLYVLAKLFFFELHLLDRIIEVYVLLSLLVDFFLIPKRIEDLDDPKPPTAAPRGMSFSDPSELEAIPPPVNKDLLKELRNITRAIRKKRIALRKAPDFDASAYRDAYENFAPSRDEYRHQLLTSEIIAHRADVKSFIAFVEKVKQVQSGTALVAVMQEINTHLETKVQQSVL